MVKGPLQVVAEDNDGLHAGVAAEGDIWVYLTRRDGL